MSPGLLRNIADDCALLRSLEDGSYLVLLDPPKERTREIKPHMLSFLSNEVLQEGVARTVPSAEVRLSHKARHWAIEILRILMHLRHLWKTLERVPFDVPSYGELSEEYASKLYCLLELLQKKETEAENPISLDRR